MANFGMGFFGQRGDFPDFGGPKGIYVMNTTDKTNNKSSNDYLAGQTVRIKWETLHTGPGTYSWSIIDDMLPAAQSRRQSVTLELMSGFPPAHVLANLSEASWIDQKGGTTCVPWDQNAQAAWTEFIVALANHLTPLSTGGYVRLADHPALLTVDAPMIGSQSVRDVPGTLTDRPDYTRAKYLDACSFTVQLMRDNFPDQFIFVGVFPTEDSIPNPRLDIAAVDHILNEFVPPGELNPKVGFFQELLSDAGPEPAFIGSPLLRGRERTWVMFQALTTWVSPFTGADKVTSGDCTVGIEYMQETYGCDYIELYFKDGTYAPLEESLTEWAGTLTDDLYPLPPQTAPSVTISNPHEGDMVSEARQITAVVTPSEGRTTTQVEFRANGVLLQTDMVAPWGYTWATAVTPNGPCSIEVRATDNVGEVGNGYRNVIVQNSSSAPYIEITSPEDGDIVSGNVTLECFTADDTGVSQVEFIIDGVIKKTDTDAPFGYTWNTTTHANGAALVELRATDTTGNTTTTSITLFVANPE